MGRERGLEALFCNPLKPGIRTEGVGLSTAERVQRIMEGWVKKKNSKNC